MSIDGDPPTPSSPGLGPVRRFAAAVSAGAMALAWASQEAAPAGAAVIVDHEVYAVQRNGQGWTSPQTLAFAVILRPPLTPEEADVPWLLAAVGAARGVEALGSRPVFTWWPDSLVDADGRVVGAIKADVRLGPGRVRDVVVTIRLDLMGLGLGDQRDDEVVDSIRAALAEDGEELIQGTVGVIAGYERRCSLLGRKIKLRLLPRGETRGVAASIDRHGRLQLESATGMCERISIDMLRDFEVVGERSIQL